MGLKISALQPLTADPVLSWDQRVTSVAVTSTGHHTVALLGTQRGTLKKVRRGACVGKKLEQEASKLAFIRLK